jgi:hypothetical protein
MSANDIIQTGLRASGEPFFVSAGSYLLIGRVTNPSSVSATVANLAMLLADGTWQDLLQHKRSSFVTDPAAPLRLPEATYRFVVFSPQPKESWSFVLIPTEKFACRFEVQPPRKNLWRLLCDHQKTIFKKA